MASRVQTIFAAVVEKHQAGVSREDVIKMLETDFAVAKTVTAVTYYNDALRAAGLSKRAAKVVVAAPVVQKPAEKVVQISTVTGEVETVVSVQREPEVDKSVCTEITRKFGKGKKQVTRIRNKYYWEGHDAYKKGTEMVNPYHFTSSQGVDYARGWGDAIQDLKKYSDDEDEV